MVGGFSLDQGRTDGEYVQYWGPHAPAFTSYISFPASKLFGFGSINLGWLLFATSKGLAPALELFCR